MKNLERLKKAVPSAPEKGRRASVLYMAKGYRAHYDEAATIARAYASACLFREHEKFIYPCDLIAGSIRGTMVSEDKVSSFEYDDAARVCGSYGARHFGTNADHFAPDYYTFLALGIDGMMKKIAASSKLHENEPSKVEFLLSCKISLEAFSDMISDYAESARAAADSADNEDKRNLLDIADICGFIAHNKPRTFRQALQLLWLCHIAFCVEGRYAMALGRLDRILYPYYKADVESGVLTRECAVELIACTLYKITEARLFGGDDVVNIAIGGINPDGSEGVNELSYIILEAVRECGVPGPNLSARLHTGIPDEFIDACLCVIGTGLGYPALMNDDINIPALTKHGYAVEDARNYCMVGCIENFIQGCQPPWSDGRFNSPKYIEYALNDGVCMLTNTQRGIHTGNPSDFRTMEEFLRAVREQMVFGASEYMMYFRNENDRYNAERYTQPFLSLFCRDCVERGQDINCGGALYPSVHGAGCMGIAMFADSLAAIEETVYNKKICDMKTLVEALKADFVGFEELRAQLSAAPKYGNNIEAVDKYAVWFVQLHSEIFSKYKTRDGGAIYTAIASNVSNIPAGAEIAASADGRKSRAPVSDAASPMHGRDRKGPTAAFLSLSKPDYTLVSCGTVVNQKYSPSMFSDPEKREKLLTLIKTYFSLGGQEVQINAVSKKVLRDAMAHPENYSDLVVRVSGFSAYYNSLSNEVKLDILERTEHE